jgi:hypothetical protein
MNSPLFLMKPLSIMLAPFLSASRRRFRMSGKPVAIGRKYDEVQRPATRAASRASTKKSRSPQPFTNAASYCCLTRGGERHRAMILPGNLANDVKVLHDLVDRECGRVRVVDDHVAFVLQ